MSIRIVTDSASDITPAEAKAWGVTIIPLIVNFGGKEYADGIDISTREFYEKLIESDALPTTSQVTPAAFHRVFEALTAQGDTVIAITLSSKLSGTYQSACIAASDFEGKVFPVDSLSATIGQRLLVLTCMDYCRQGLSPQVIQKKLEQDREKICVLALLDTLEYLKKGGRISPTVAFAGELLSIRPVVTLENGSVVLVGKARGSKNGNNLLRKLVDQVGGIDYSRHFCLIYSGLSDHKLQKYIEDSADLWQGKAEHLPIACLGAVIGTHIGPNAVGFAFFRF